MDGGKEGRKTKEGSPLPLLLPLQKGTCAQSDRNPARAAGGKVMSSLVPLCHKGQGLPLARAEGSAEPWLPAQEDCHGLECIPCKFVR